MATAKTNDFKLMKPNEANEQQHEREKRRCCCVHACVRVFVRSFVQHIQSVLWFGSVQFSTGLHHITKRMKTKCTHTHSQPHSRPCIWCWVVSLYACMDRDDGERVGIVIRYTHFQAMYWRWFFSQLHACVYAWLCISMFFSLYICLWCMPNLYDCISTKNSVWWPANH